MASVSEQIRFRMQVILTMNAQICECLKQHNKQMGNQGCCQSRDQGAKELTQDQQANQTARYSAMQKKQIGEEDPLDTFLEQIRNSKTKERKSAILKGHTGLQQHMGSDTSCSSKESEKSFGDLLIEDIILQTDLVQQSADGKWVNLFQDPDLQIFGLQWNTEANTITNLIRGEYILKCTPQEYIRITNDIECMKAIDPRIEELACISHNKGFKEYQYYVAYRGMLIISGRDYCYFKKVKQMSRSRNVWFEVSRSIENDQYPAAKKKTRGFINLHGAMIQPLSSLPASDYPHVEDRHKHCVVRFFSDIDTKMKLELKVASKQIVSEMKSYVERFRKQL